MGNSERITLSWVYAYGMEIERDNRGDNRENNNPKVKTAKQKPRNGIKSIFLSKFVLKKN